MKSVTTKTILISLALSGIAIITAISLLSNQNNIQFSPPECTPDQVIFKLSAETNAHAEVWDGASSYPVKICYDAYFQGQGAGNRGSGTVLKLSASTNAHAEGPAQNNYQNNLVFYDELSCELKLSGDTCGLIGDRQSTTIAYLSGQTNAHISLTQGNYPYQLCCASSEHEPLGATHSICENEMCVQVPGDGENECSIDADCEDDGGGGGDDFCTDYGEYTENYPEDEGQSCTDQLPVTHQIINCGDYNKLTENYNLECTTYDGTLNEFKEEACITDCANAGLNNGGQCVWDATAGCQLQLVGNQGTQCRVEYNQGNTCTGDQTSRTIHVTVTTIPEGKHADCEICGGLSECDIQVPCGRVIQLPFFTTLNFILTALVITILYLFHFHRKKE